jgi:hypothetical protein
MSQLYNSETGVDMERLFVTFRGTRQKEFIFRIAVLLSLLQKHTGLNKQMNYPHNKKTHFVRRLAIHIPWY